MSDKRKPLRRFTAGVDKGFDNPEADITAFVSLAQHGHIFGAGMDLTPPDPGFAGPSFCFTAHNQFHEY